MAGREESAKIVAPRLSLFSVLISLLERRRVNDVREAVAIAVLQVGQIQAIGGTHVAKGVRSNLLAVDVFDPPLDFARHAEKPFGVEALQSCVHPLDDKVLGDLA